MVVDGEVGSTSVLRYLNHSCEPNAEMKFIWLSNGKRRMLFIELLTFDHQNQAFLLREGTLRTRPSEGILEYSYLCVAWQGAGMLCCSRCVTSQRARKLHSITTS